MAVSLSSFSDIVSSARRADSKTSSIVLHFCCTNAEISDFRPVIIAYTVTSCTSYMNSSDDCSYDCLHANNCFAAFCFADAGDMICIVSQKNHEAVHKFRPVKCGGGMSIMRSAISSADAMSAAVLSMYVRYCWRRRR